MRTKRVVVIGGGPAGRSVINELHSQAKKGVKRGKNEVKIEVVLIERKDYGDNVPAAVRCLVDPSFFANLSGSLEDMYRNYESPHFSVRVILGDVQTVLEMKIIVGVPLSSGEDEQMEVVYDALVIATGTDYPIFKGKVMYYQQRKNEMQYWYERIKNANHILLVGGGVVGVEIAGEILSVYPQKHITLVHAHQKLMDSCSSYTSEACLKKLLQFPSVKVLLGQRVVPEQIHNNQFSEGTVEYQTTQGEVVQADLALVTTGYSRPNTRMLETAFPHVLNSKGFIKALSSLLVEGCSNIFTLGDCADLKVGKLNANVHKQGRVVAKNIWALLRTGTAPKTYTSGYIEPPVVIVGPKYGIISAVNIHGKSPHGAWVSRIKTHLYVDSRLKPVSWTD